MQTMQVVAVRQGDTSSRIHRALTGKFQGRRVYRAVIDRTAHSVAFPAGFHAHRDPLRAQEPERLRWPPAQTPQPTRRPAEGEHCPARNT